jgi:transcriptional regulator with XRE-family HTH domain
VANHRSTILFRNETPARGVGIDFGNKIKALRAEKKLSQRALSALSGVSHSRIGRIERCDFGSLSKPKRIALAQALETTLDWLESGEGERTTREGGAASQYGRAAASRSRSTPPLSVSKEQLEQAHVSAAGPLRNADEE